MSRFETGQATPEREDGAHRRRLRADDSGEPAYVLRHGARVSRRLRFVQSDGQEACGVVMLSRLQPDDGGAVREDALTAERAWVIPMIPV